VRDLGLDRFSVLFFCFKESSNFCKVVGDWVFFEVYLMLIRRRGGIPWIYI